jgi:hypothetical protein
MRRPSALFLAACLVSCAASAAAATPAPPRQAAAAGYRTLTFATVGDFTPKTVDQKLTYAPGYQWYFYNFIGVQPEPSLTTLNADSSMTLSVRKSYFNATISTAGRIPARPYYRGVAFGGGAYFEVTLAFDASAVDTSTGWPSTWTYPLEQLAEPPDTQWAGQARGYVHFVEPDIFEYVQGSSVPGAYFGSIHDWYGVWDKTCPHSYCELSSDWNDSVRRVPAATDFAAFHRYGMLWRPATAARKGEVTYYFDGVQVGPSIRYVQFTDQRPPPAASSPWTFAVMDREHFVLILGVGASTPMRVRSVVVWQADASQNLHS